VSKYKTEVEEISPSVKLVLGDYSRVNEYLMIFWREDIAKVTRALRQK
jgi:hypothetical protein